MELGGGGWSWVEVDGAGCRWVHGLVIPILMSGKNDVEHFENLRKVLKIFYDNGLHLKFKKMFSCKMKWFTLELKLIRMVYFL